MTTAVLARSAFWTLLSHLLSRGAVMAAAIVLARSLNANDFAAYSYFQLSVSVLSAYASLGLGVAASRFFAEIEVSERDEFPPVLTLWTLSIFLAVAVFFVILLLPSSLLSSNLAIPKWMFAIGVMVYVLQIVPSGAILGLEKYKDAAKISAMSGVFVLSGVLIASSESSPWIAIAALIGGAAVQFLGESVIVFRSVPRNVWRFIRVRFLPDLRAILKLAGPMLGVSLLAASGTWILGRFLLSGGNGTAEFSMYSIGLQWFSLVLLLPGMVSRVILPRIVRASTSPGGGVQKLTRQAAGLAALTAGGIALVGILLSSYIAKLYGPLYAERYGVLAAFLIAGALSSVVNTIGNAIVGRNGQKVWLFLTAVWLISIVVIGFETRGLGAISGAISLGGAALVHTLLTLVMARRMGVL
ncbi:oligosaccharide flippase family protein [Variovorax sp. LT1R16]|uniref:oligosaccharide flippase family protein n=1 Tax=Variovorax sp. LT1R16 TaxID=3443728 RepID=UPI003F466A40